MYQFFISNEKVLLMYLMRSHNFLYRSLYSDYDQVFVTYLNTTLSCALEVTITTLIRCFDALLNLLPSIIQYFGTFHTSSCDKPEVWSGVPITDFVTCLTSTRCSIFIPTHVTCISAMTVMMPN